MLKSKIQHVHFSMLQEIKGLREELSTRLNSSDTMEIIKEKEEQIRGLLEEGQLPHTSTLDRLYSQENVSLKASTLTCTTAAFSSLYLASQKVALSRVMVLRNRIVIGQYLVLVLEKHLLGCMPLPKVAEYVSVSMYMTFR